MRFTPARILAGTGDWLFRVSALRQARLSLPSQDADRRRATDQARLLLEVARRADEPVERLPPGSRQAVSMLLCREAARWAVDSTDPGRAALLATEGAIPQAALEGEAVHLSVTAAEVKSVRAVAESLLAEFEEPRARVARLQAQRWVGVFLLLVLLTVLGWALRKVILGPDLAASRPFRTSSSYAGCAASNDCSRLLFHTEDQVDPWVEFDLGSSKRVHRIEITNRGDCCEDRATPMVAEVSIDRATWTEVARNENIFSTWTARFQSTSARYVRLRVSRRTTLHLSAVAIR